MGLLGPSVSPPWHYACGHGHTLGSPEMCPNTWGRPVIEHTGGEEAKLQRLSVHIWRKVGGGGGLKAKHRYGDGEDTKTHSKGSNSIYRRAQRQVRATSRHSNRSNSQVQTYRLSRTHAVVTYRSTCAIIPGTHRHPSTGHSPMQTHSYKDNHTKGLRLQLFIDTQCSNSQTVPASPTPGHQTVQLTATHFLLKAKPITTWQTQWQMRQPLTDIKSQE